MELRRRVITAFNVHGDGREGRDVRGQPVIGVVVEPMCAGATIDSGSKLLADVI
jgi:hypothetical protein